MNQTVKETVEYYIVFSGSTSKHWIFKWLHGNIQHVSAIRKSPGKKFWLVVDPCMSHTRLSMVPVTINPLTQIDGKIDSVFPVTAHIDSNQVIHGIGIFSCVSVVKGLLGIKKRFILTPYQLYKYLRRKGHGEQR